MARRMSCSLVLVVVWEESKGRTLASRERVTNMISVPAQVMMLPRYFRRHARVGGHGEHRPRAAGQDSRLIERVFSVDQRLVHGDLVVLVDILRFVVQVYGAGEAGVAHAAGVHAPRELLQLQGKAQAAGFRSRRKWPGCLRKS